MENQILFCFSAKSPFLTQEKVVNVHKVYELDNWPTNPSSNFTIKNYLFGAVNYQEMQSKENSFTMVTEQDLIEVLHEVLVMIFTEMV